MSHSGPGSQSQFLQHFVDDRGVTIEAMQFSYLAPGDAIEEWATFTGEAMAAPGANNPHVKAILKANK